QEENRHVTLGQWSLAGGPTATRHGLTLEQRLQPVQPAAQLLAAGGERQAHVALGPAGGPGNQAHVGRLERGLAEARGGGDRVVAEATPEVCRNVEKGVEGALRHGADYSGHGVEPSAHQVTPGLELAPHLFDALLVTLQSSQGGVLRDARRTAGLL